MEALYQAILEGEDDLALEKAQGCLAAGLQADALVRQAVVPAIEEAGRRWQSNQYFLPDVVLCAVAFKAAMGELSPRLSVGQSAKRGRVLIGTVAGDMHDLGKSIVVAMLTGAGFEAIDLGVDVPIETFVQKTKELHPDIVGMGAYMTTTMLQMREVISGLQREGLRGKVKVMIGGVPTSPEFAQEIGADLWGKDALDALSKVSAATAKSA